MSNKKSPFNWELSVEQASELVKMLETAVESGKNIVKQQRINKVPEALVKLYVDATNKNELYLNNLKGQLKGHK